MATSLKYIRPEAKPKIKYKLDKEYIYDKITGQ